VQVVEGTDLFQYFVTDAGFVVNMVFTLRKTLFLFFQQKVGTKNELG